MNIFYIFSPLNNEFTIQLFEQHYLTTTLKVTHLNHVFNNFFPFKYVQKIVLTNDITFNNTILNLLTSLKIFDLQNEQSTTLNNLKINNWNELCLLKNIYHYDNLDISYPQIQHEHSRIESIKPTLKQIINGIL
ncbi:hypothetical protein QTN25_007016 [Entamoeba marina]